MKYTANEYTDEQRAVNLFCNKSKSYCNQRGKERPERALYLGGFTASLAYESSRVAAGITAVCKTVAATLLTSRHNFFVSATFGADTVGAVYPAFVTAVGTGKSSVCAFGYESYYQQSDDEKTGNR